MNRTDILAAFKNYAAKYNINDVKITLKIAHTYRVAEISERISKSISQNIDSNLAWLLGIFHDIGRFEQVKRFGTFLDVASVDHAELGADILFNDGLINEFQGIRKIGKT